MKKKYYCRHCNKSYDEWYLADLCFKIDMEELENDKLDTANRKRKDDKRNKPDNVRKSKMV